MPTRSCPFAAPRFTRKEYKTRISKIRSEMASRAIEVLILFSPKNLYYCTGFETAMFNYQAFVIPAEGKPVLFLRELEKGVGEITTRMDDIRIWEDHRSPTETLVSLLREKGWFDCAIGIEKTSPFLTVRCGEELAAAFGRQALDGSECVNKARVVKSSQEIEYIRKAAGLTRIGMEAAVNAVSEGTSENNIAAAFYSAMIKAGSEALLLDPTVSSGPMSGVAHSNWHRYVLTPGDAVILEFSGIWNSYAAPLMRTVAVLEASDQVVKMANACIEALDSAVQTIKAGVTSGQVDASCRAVMERWGYGPLFRKRLGYSVGIVKPVWDEADILDLKRDDPRELEANMVLHIVPALREYPKFGAGFSETVLVTRTGCEVITDFPRSLHISVR